MIVSISIILPKGAEASTLRLRCPINTRVFTLHKLIEHFIAERIRASKLQNSVILCSPFTLYHADSNSLLLLHAATLTHYIPLDSDSITLFIVPYVSHTELPQKLKEIQSDIQSNSVRSAAIHRKDTLERLECTIDATSNESKRANLRAIFRHSGMPAHLFYQAMFQYSVPLSFLYGATYRTEGDISSIINFTRTISEGTSLRLTKIITRQAERTSLCYTNANKCFLFRPDFILGVLLRPSLVAHSRRHGLFGSAIARAPLAYVLYGCMSGHHNTRYIPSRQPKIYPSDRPLCSSSEKFKPLASAEVPLETLYSEAEEAANGITNNVTDSISPPEIPVEDSSSAKNTSTRRDSNYTSPRVTTPLVYTQRASLDRVESEDGDSGHMITCNKNLANNASLGIPNVPSAPHKHQQKGSILLAEPLGRSHKHFRQYGSISDSLDDATQTSQKRFQTTLVVPAHCSKENPASAPDASSITPSINTPGDGDSSTASSSLQKKTDSQMMAPVPLAKQSAKEFVSLSKTLSDGQVTIFRSMHAGSDTVSPVPTEQLFPWGNSKPSLHSELSGSTHLVIPELIDDIETGQQLWTALKDCYDLCPLSNQRFGDRQLPSSVEVFPEAPKGNMLLSLPIPSSSKFHPFSSAHDASIDETSDSSIRHWNSPLVTKYSSQSSNRGLPVNVAHSQRSVASIRSLSQKYSSPQTLRSMVLHNGTNARRNSTYEFHASTDERMSELRVSSDFTGKRSSCTNSNVFSLPVSMGDGCTMEVDSMCNIFCPQHELSQARHQSFFHELVRTVSEYYNNCMELSILELSDPPYAVLTSRSYTVHENSVRSLHFARSRRSSIGSESRCVNDLRDDNSTDENKDVFKHSSWATTNASQRKIIRSNVQASSLSGLTLIVKKILMANLTPLLPQYKSTLSLPTSDYNLLYVRIVKSLSTLPSQNGSKTCLQDGDIDYLLKLTPYFLADELAHLVFILLMSSQHASVVSTSMRIRSPSDLLLVTPGSDDFLIGHRFLIEFSTVRACLRRSVELTLTIHNTTAYFGYDNVAARLSQLPYFLFDSHIYSKQQAASKPNSNAMTSNINSVAPVPLRKLHGSAASRRSVEYPCPTAADALHHESSDSECDPTFAELPYEALSVNSMRRIWPCRVLDPHTCLCKDAYRGSPTAFPLREYVSQKDSFTHHSAICQRLLDYFDKPAEFYTERSAEFEKRLQEDQQLSLQLQKCAREQRQFYIELTSANTSSHKLNGIDTKTIRDCLSLQVNKLRFRPERLLDFLAKNKKGKPYKPFSDVISYQKALFPRFKLNAMLEWLEFIHIFSKEYFGKEANNLFTTLRLSATRTSMQGSAFSRPPKLKNGESAGSMHDDTDVPTEETVTPSMGKALLGKERAIRTPISHTHDGFSVMTNCESPDGANANDNMHTDTSSSDLNASTDTSDDERPDQSLLTSIASFFSRIPGSLIFMVSATLVHNLRVIGNTLSTPFKSPYILEYPYCVVDFNWSLDFDISYCDIPSGAYVLYTVWFANAKQVSSILLSKALDKYISTVIQAFGDNGAPSFYHMTDSKAAVGSRDGQDAPSDYVMARQSLIEGGLLFPFGTLKLSIFDHNYRIRAGTQSYSMWPSLCEKYAMKLAMTCENTCSSDIILDVRHITNDLHLPYYKSHKFLSTASHSESSRLTIENFCGSPPERQSAISNGSSNERIEAAPSNVNIKSPSISAIANDSSGIIHSAQPYSLPTASWMTKIKTIFKRGDLYTNTLQGKKSVLETKNPLKVLQYVCAKPGPENFRLRAFSNQDAKLLERSQSLAGSETTPPIGINTSLNFSFPKCNVTGQIAQLLAGQSVRLESSASFVQAATSDRESLATASEGILKQSTLRAIINRQSVTSMESQGYDAFSAMDNTFDKDPCLASPSKSSVGTSLTRAQLLFDDLSSMNSFIELLRADASRLDDAKYNYIWEHRHIIKFALNLLPRLLQIARYWNIDSADQTNELIFALMNSQIPAHTAIDLLNIDNDDRFARRLAIKSLSGVASEDLSLLCLQLVQVCKFDTEAVTLQGALLSRAVADFQGFGFTFFWAVRSEMQTNAAHCHVYQAMLLKLLQALPHEHTRDLLVSEFIIGFITSIAYRVAGAKLEMAKEQRRDLRTYQSCIFDSELVELCGLIEKLLDGAGVSYFLLPLSSKHRYSGLDLTQCKIMDSKKSPLWLTFVAADDPAVKRTILMKVDDDLRQDQLTLQLLTVMDNMWVNKDINLEMKLYTCASTGPSEGLIEVVQSSYTMADITAQYGGAAAAFNKKPLSYWLQNYSYTNRNATSMQIKSFLVIDTALKSLLLQTLGDRNTSLSLDGENAKASVKTAIHQNQCLSPMMERLSVSLSRELNDPILDGVGSSSLPPAVQCATHNRTSDADSSDSANLMVYPGKEQGDASASRWRKSLHSKTRSSRVRTAQQTYRGSTSTELQWDVLDSLCLDQHIVNIETDTEQSDSENTNNSRSQTLRMVSPSITTKPNRSVSRHCATEPSCCDSTESSVMYQMVLPTHTNISVSRLDKLNTPHTQKRFCFSLSMHNEDSLKGSTFDHAHQFSEDTADALPLSKALLSSNGSPQSLSKASTNTAGYKLILPFVSSSNDTLTYTTFEDNELSADRADNVQSTLTSFAKGGLQEDLNHIANKTESFYLKTQATPPNPLSLNTEIISEAAQSVGSGSFSTFKRKVSTLVEQSNNNFSENALRATPKKVNQLLSGTSTRKHSNFEVTLHSMDNSSPNLPAVDLTGRTNDEQEAKQALANQTLYRIDDTSCKMFSSQSIDPHSIYDAPSISKIARHTHLLRKAKTAVLITMPNQDAKTSDSSALFSENLMARTANPRRHSSLHVTTTELPHRHVSFSTASEFALRGRNSKKDSSTTLLQKRRPLRSSHGCTVDTCTDTYLLNVLVDTSNPLMVILLEFANLQQHKNDSCTPRSFLSIKPTMSDSMCDHTTDMSRPNSFTTDVFTCNRIHLQPSDLKDVYLPSTNTYQRVVERFRDSTAAYCVASYIIGLGDRHNDNVMLCRDGTFFHIDFGHFLGHFKKKFGFKREKAPFFLTPEMVFVMKEFDSLRQTGVYANFKSVACNAYLIVRNNYRLLMILFRLMFSTGIKELTSEGDLMWIRKALSLGIKDADAYKRFDKLIDESVNAKSTLFNNFVHLIVHKDGRTKADP